MGVNYYWYEKPARLPCRACGRAYNDDGGLHIGKSSPGWTFNFRAHRDRGIVSWAMWRSKILSGGEIRDEEGVTVPVDFFIRKVEAKRSEGHSHAREYATHWGYTPDDRPFLDSEGHSFSPGEFS